MDNAKIRENLQHRLADSEQRLARLREDLSMPLSADFADQAAQTEDDEAQEAEDAVLARSIGMLKAALSRLDSGEYGYCTRCGKQIQQGRLDAIPEAALCIVCASKAQSGA